jgi:hypothetical protein
LETHPPPTRIARKIVSNWLRGPATVNTDCSLRSGRMSSNGPAKRTAKDDPPTSADAREKGATPTGHGAKSPAVREAAILALLTEKSIQRAAEWCRVNERTLRRWLTEDAAFLAEYDHARQALHRAGMARVQALTGKGVETLEELVDAKEFRAVRLGAARTVIELGIHQHDTEIILRKLEDLEAAHQRGRR